MLPMRSVNDILNRDYLEIRARLLELAAALDRIDRAGGSGLQLRDVRLEQIRSALEALAIPEPDRAKTVQLLFSLDYDPEWLEWLGLAAIRDGKAAGS